MESIEATQEKLREILIDVLGVDREEMRPSARFFEDLGGESIDMLDLQFKCQKQFGVKIDFQKAIPTEQIAATNDGRLTAEAVAAIRARFPFVDAAAFKVGMNLDQVRELFTVEALEHLLVAALKEAESEPIGAPSLA